MNLPEELRYTKDHEWIKLEGDQAVVGITDYAQSELGDIVFVEVPTVGETLSQGDTLATVEAVKTVADVYMPVDGEVLEMNPALENTPELINQDPYGKGWIARIKVTNPDQVNNLLTADQYKELINA
jgi:glycine cleavage system H protein